VVKATSAGWSAAGDQLVLRRFRSKRQATHTSGPLRHHAHSDEVEDVKQAIEALQRWEGEGGSAADPFRVADHLGRRADAAAMAVALARRARASWPGWTSGPKGKLTPPRRVSRSSRDVHDLTDPGVRAYGYYLIKVPSTQYSQLMRASHATAARVARSRTQYGPSELHFLEAIETPALD
jgi:hypothetical protein